MSRVRYENDTVRQTDRWERVGEEVNRMFDCCTALRAERVNGDVLLARSYQP